MSRASVLSEVIVWVRRIIKATNSTSITDATIRDYINRFYVYDVPERIQLFELKRQYVFETIKNVFMYQFPYQEYQIIRQPVYCDGIEVGFYTDNTQFYRIFPETVNNQNPIQGDGTPGAYSWTMQSTPILRGFVDDLGYLTPYVYLTGTTEGGEPSYVVDGPNIIDPFNGFVPGSGCSLAPIGTLYQTDKTFQKAPNGVDAPIDCGNVNYETGELSWTFFQDIQDQTDINVISSPFSAGKPRIMLFFNNIMKVYPIPDRPYKMTMDVQITPAEFLSSDAAVPFAYMSEYIARGAARKILSDTGDETQIAFYEPFFREQECLVLRRTNRQQQTTRQPTIFSGVTGTNATGGWGQW